MRPGPFASTGCRSGTRPAGTRIVRRPGPRLRGLGARDDPAEVRNHQGSNTRTRSAWPSSTTTSGSSAVSRTPSEARPRARWASTPATKVVYFPRRSFDLWNTRYFILPSVPQRLDRRVPRLCRFPPQDRAGLSAPSRRRGPNGRQEIRTWIETQDYQILRNLQAYPRAWVVHDARPAPDGGPARRAAGPMQEILYADDPIWHDANQTAYDPHRLAWMTATTGCLRPYLTGAVPRSSETVKVSYPSPQGRARREPRLARHRRPGRRLLPRLDADDRRQARADLPRQPGDARRRGPVGPPRLVYTFDPPRSASAGR